VEGDNAYDDAKASGANEEQAQRERVVVGSLNAIIEAVQIGRVMKFAKGGKHSLKNFVKLARTKGMKIAGKELKGWSGEIARLSVEEALEEFSQEGVSLSVPAVFRGEYPKKEDGSPDWLTIGERLGEAALGGAVAGPMLGGAGRMVSGRGTDQAVTKPDEVGQPPINVYKTTSDSRTGITEEEVVRDGERYVDSVTGEDVVLDTEASGSAIAPAETKQPWEMTKDEFESVKPQAAVISEQGNTYTGITHGHAFNAAIEAGDTVDTSVQGSTGWVVDEFYVEEPIGLGATEVEQGRSILREGIVRQAVEQGKPVPVEVLAEYPDLAPAEAKGPFDYATTDYPIADAALKNGTAEVVEMTPYEYIDKAAKLQGITPEESLKATDQSKVQKYMLRMKKGDKFPMLVLEEGTQNQEGRHRALAAEELYRQTGERIKVPVVVIKQSAPVEATAEVIESQGTTVDRIDGSAGDIHFSTEAHKEREIQKLVDEGMSREDAKSVVITEEEYKAELKQIEEQKKADKKVRKAAIKEAGPKGQIKARLDTIKKKSPSRNARRRMSRTMATLSAIKDKLVSYVYRQDRIYNLGRMLDGYDSNGPITTYIVRPVRAAIVRARDNATTAFEKIRQTLDDNNIDFSKISKRKKTNFSGGLRLSGTDMTGIYLLSQNEHGRRRLDEDLHKEVVDEIVEAVKGDSELMVLAEAVQAYVAERSQIFLATAEAMGIEVTPEEAYITLMTLDPSEIDKMPIVERFKKKLKAGVKARGEEKTISRTKTQASVEFDLLKVLPNMVQGMENFIEVGPAAQVVDEILRDKGVRKKLNEATRGQGFDIFHKWLQQSASGYIDRGSGVTGKTVNYLRKNAMLYVLGYKIMSVVPKQALSAWNAIAIRPAIMPGVMARLASYGDMGLLHQLEKDFNAVIKKSLLVKNRDWERDTRRTYNAKGMRKFFNHQKLSPLSMRWTATVDRATVTAVWASSYERAIADGMEEKVAVQYADDMVSQTQPMGNVEDLPEFFRGGQVDQAISTFMNQPNQNLNNLRHNVWGEMRAGKISKAKALQRFLIGQVLTSQLLGLISRGRLPDDPLEAAQDLAFYLATPWFFFGRWGYNAVTGLWDAEESAVSTLPLTAFREASQTIRYAKKGEVRETIEHGVGTVGALTGKIPQQFITTTGGIVDLVAGEADDIRRLYYSKYMAEKVAN